MRIVLDTNVLIAAALKGDFSEDILKIASKGNLFTLLSSEDILNELQKTLAFKFRWHKTDIESFNNAIKLICEIIEINERIFVIERDQKDNIILECAVSGNADLIVSSDQDLIDLKDFRGIGIVHPKTLSWTFPEYFKKFKKR